MADDTPKIHVDDDWKQQAQAEKEKLAQEVEQQAANAGDVPVGAEGLPEPSFGEIIDLVAAQAFMFLGDTRDPESGQMMVSLPLAKHFIDLLGVLDSKVKDVATPEEKKLLDQRLYEARMRYVQFASGGMGGGGTQPSAGPDQGT
jgi:hypothetical protein